MGSARGTPSGMSERYRRLDATVARYNLIEQRDTLKRAFDEPKVLTTTRMREQKEKNRGHICEK